MSAAVLGKLLAIIVTVALGWLAGRLRWLGDAQSDPARILSNAAFYIFVPALLFRTTARVDLGALPAGLLVAYFVPTLALLLAVYGVQQLRQRRQPQAEPALPAVRAISVSYGNAVQMGIPMSAAMFGEAGLGIHLMLVSVHGLILLTVLTALVEMDLARSKARQMQGSGLALMLRSTLRNTVIHPVVLPVLIGADVEPARPGSARTGGRGAAAAGQRGGAAVPGADRPVAGLLRAAGQRAWRAGRDAAQAAGPAGAGADRWRTGASAWRACRCRCW